MRPKVESTLSNECRISIGDFCFSIECRDTPLTPYFREYYSGFLMDGYEPDLVIELEVIRHPPGAYEIPLSLFATKVVRENRFSFGSGLLEGSLRLSEKRCKVVVKEVLLGGPGIRSFERFLCQVYYTLLHNHNSWENSFLVHASGVSRDGKGFVFSGPSGCGKSTIASLSSEETILNDDTVIVEKQNGKYWVRSTPFNGRFKDKKNSRAPLRAVFLLEHARENHLKQIGKTEFVSRFVKEVGAPVPLLSMDRKGALLRMLDFCSQLVEQIPVYVLGFRPDRNFWKCIQEADLL